MSLDPGTARFLLETADRMERETAEWAAVSRRIARRTTLIVNVSMAVFFGMALLIFVLIFRMAYGLTSLVDNMEDMYGRFGEMAQDMDSITASVHRINTNIGGMPIIATEMSGMSTSVERMHEDVAVIASALSSVTRATSGIDQSVDEMTGHFVQLDGTVNRINSSVHQMSRPMHMMRP